MNDVYFWGGHEEEGGKDLVSELADEVEGDTVEVGVAKEVVEVVGEQLEDQA